MFSFGNPSSDSRNRGNYGSVIGVVCGGRGGTSLVILNLLKHFPWDWKTPSECYEEAEEAEKAAGLDHIVASTSTTTE